MGRIRIRRASALAGAVLAFGFFAAPVARAETDDPWFGRDKALHFGVSAGLSASGYALSALVFDEPYQRALAGAAFALSAGLAKEAWDLTGHGNASWKDLAWDGIGVAAGVSVALSVDLWLIGTKNDVPGTARLDVRF